MTDDIRRRLEAIQGINWSEVKHETGEEYYGNWVKVGPVRMLTTDPDDEPWLGYPSYWPEERRRAHREHARAERAEEDAIVEFLTHAADDIRRLRAELDAVNDALREAGIGDPLGARGVRDLNQLRLGALAARDEAVADARDSTEGRT